MATAAVTVLCTASTAGAQAATERLLVYVDDLAPGDKSMELDAQAITSSLCAALAKDKRLDVLCAPDVRQILSFAATSALVGTSSGPTQALEQRMDRAKHVIHGTLKRDGQSYVLVLRAGPRAAAASTSGMFSERALVAFEERAAKPHKLLDAVPAAAVKISAALFAPPPEPPPAPVTPAK
jgi:hypothetical protein